MREIRYIVVHHSATPLATAAQDIEEWHVARGFDSIGYNLVVESDGKLVQGRPIEKIGAHCRGVGNSYGIGICLIGDNTTMEDRWTQAQTRSLGMLHFVLSAMYPEAVWLGHRDMPGAKTLCPGLDIRTLLGLPPLEYATMGT